MLLSVQTYTKAISYLAARSAKSFESLLALFEVGANRPGLCVGPVLTNVDCIHRQD